MTSEGRDEHREERPSGMRTESEATREQGESPEDLWDDGDSREVSGDGGTASSEGRDEHREERPSEMRAGRARGRPKGGSSTSATREQGKSLFGGEAENRQNGDRENGQRAESIEESDDEDEEVEPVEVLVQLADAGEIDPWDIDVVHVTDTFLSVIDESDLRTSGRALFYASVLIRMKSDAMLNDGEEAKAPAEPWEQAMSGEDPIEEPDPFASLEQEMDRRLERRRARGMPQTLDELVRDLREAERDSWWKESRSYDTSDSPSGFQRGTQELDYRSAGDMRMDDEPTADEVTANTHGENVDEIIDDVYAAVREQYDAGREEVLFREVQGTGGSRVETFLGLLFLSHRGRVRLQQDDLFGDLWIQDPSTGTGSEEALAD
ncbi:segregation/condensation protein A [Halobacteriales archaeon QS_4_62_28]|nr:MAG: segregation/condensation protein A [Halobacteriales archaeon QS_4_62_28]